MKLATDMGLKEAADYTIELKKAEKAKGLAEQRTMSSRPGSRKASRQGSAVSGVGSPVGSRTPSRGGGSAVSRLALDEETGYSPATKEVDPSYSDPLGPMPERPKTSAATRPGVEDDFADEEIGDDLLPE